MKSSLEIAREATLRPIVQIARELGLDEDEIELYGTYKAKVSPLAYERRRGSSRTARRSSSRRSRRRRSAKARRRPRSALPRA